MDIEFSTIENFIDIALREDIGDRDHTTLATIEEDKIGNAQIIAKEEGILAGIDIAVMVFSKLDRNIKYVKYKNDGEKLSKGDVIVKLSGKVIAILMGERVALNIIQRLSGIASQTHKYVKQIEGYNTIILDTRKTTPGMRLLDKYAVKVGGASNHRFGLYDRILIKDNHIDFAGGIEIAIDKVHQYLNRNQINLEIEIEARSIDDVKRIMKKGGVDYILLDNFSIEQTKQAVKLINGRFKTESSGNINLSNIRDYAACGVNYISIGALTHQIYSLDFSLVVAK